MIRDINALQFSQFTIDWIGGFDDEFTIEGKDVEDGAIAYHVDTISEIMKFGKDRDFFKMLDAYCSFWMKK